MRRVIGYWLLVIGLGLILLGCTAHNQTAAIKESQIETLTPYTWDFGRVKEGTLLKHAFVFKNTSPKTLDIKDVTTSCGCTVSRAGKNSLSPGEETSIEVSFKTKGYSGPTQQFIYVHTDDLDNPVVRFIIKADVVK